MNDPHRPWLPLLALTLAILAAPRSPAEPAPSARAERDAPLVDISHEGSVWTLAGRKQTVTLHADTLGVSVQSGDQTWTMVPAKAGGLRLKTGSREFDSKLSDARRIRVAPWDTGARTGVQLTLSDWKEAPGLVLYLTLALEGKAEDLVCTAVADESHGAIVRRLDWPEALDASTVDDTVLSNMRGILLPRHFPKPYNPIRDADPNGTPDTKTEIQSNIIEDWSMSWWGFDRGKASMMVIVETPDDAAYQFSHPAGGPTVIGPRWRESLGRLGYLRKCRLCFLPQGGYVAMAKRYRQYAIDSGLFVSLKEKVARSPVVRRLIGVPMWRARILTNIKPGSDDYNRLTDKAKAHRLTTFDERAAQLRQLKANGLNHLTVVATGWPHFGYDRQHPDAIPPSPEAGGWDGLRRLAQTCRQLGYLFALHDQYRDYYVDAPSFSTEFALHEEDAATPAVEFPGSRFGDFKEGVVPYMDHWEGGKMSYLNPRFMLEHLKRNYQGLFDHGIHPNGNYLDVFGYVPPDEDFNPEHPTTRTDGRLARIACFNWCRAHLGFVGTEAGCDWTVPYVDFSSPERERKAVPLPLFNLVYHDAIITPYDVNDLHGFLNAGLPQISSTDPATGLPKPEDLEKARRMAALQRRLAFVEMTNHEFLDPDRRRERTTFADGTTVTVDWDTNTVHINPDL
jgi:hypothetical protein